MATPQLEREKWEKLVCAMFNGAKLYDRNGEPLVEGSIRSILEEYGSRGTSTFTDPSRPYYLTRVTALYQENNKGDVIVGKVLVSDSACTHDHVEKQLIAMSSEHLRAIHSIGISYSPCTDECAKALVERYKDESLPKPVIHFSWVHNHPKKEPHGRDGIKLLIENGFNLKLWETTRIAHFLLEQAPNESLKCELKLVYNSMSLKFSKRDMETQELIEEAKKRVDEDRRRKNRKRTALEEPGQKRHMKLSAQKVSYTCTRKISMFMLIIFLIQEYETV